MKTIKKYGALAAAITALLTVAFIIGCSQPIDSAGWAFGGGGNTPIPAGYGGVRIVLTNSGNPRTIIPSVDTGDNAWVSYDLEFTGATSPTITDDFSTNVSSLSTIPVPLGTYTSLKVTANTAAGAAASVTYSTQFTVTPSPVTVVPSGGGTLTLVMVSPTTTITGNGTFSYTIVNDATLLTAASIAITPITLSTGGTGITTAPASISLTPLTPGTWSNSTSFRPGYYYIDISLTKNSLSPRVFRHVLHVYQNMTSNFTYTFNNADLPKVGGDVTVNITNPTISDGDFGLVYGTSNTPLVGGGKIPNLSVTTGSPVTVTITGALTGGTISWIHDGVSLGSSITLTITPGTPPFDSPIDETITVYASAGSTPYSITFQVELIP